jgi:hypothetical protein
VIRNNIISLLILTLILSACSGTPFMGAQKVGGSSTYVERWYLKPEYKKKDIPRGTAFYGAAAQKIKNRFIIKYYQRDKRGSKIEIPPQDMWKIHHNGKPYSKQDDDDLFYYQRNVSDGYHRVWLTTSGPIALKEGYLLPIQSCVADGWCLLYESRQFNHPTYVKRSVLYQDKKGATNCFLTEPANLNRD